MDLSRDAAPNLAAAAFVALAAVWIGLRFVPVTGAPDESVRAAIEAVQVEPSVESGRLRILGLSPAGAAAPDENPEAEAARRALEARVAAIDSGLAHRAARLAGRLEEFEDGAVALRVAGLAVPFHDQDARRLARARGSAAERPWLALRTMSDVFAGRLEEPPRSIEVESTVGRRELTRTFREIQDALSGAEADAGSACEAYRSHALVAASPRPDSFRRAGRGRLLETWLAAWLAVTLRAWRRPRRTRDLAVAAAAAAVAALGAVLALEGSPLLPVDRHGVAPTFLPLSFAIGWAVAVLAETPPLAPAPVAGRPAAAPAARDEPDPTGGPAPTGRTGEAGGAPRDPDLREIARDLIAAERSQPAPRRPPVRAQAPRSEVEVEEDPVVGPGRRAFGPPGGPQPTRPRPDGSRGSDPTPASSAAPGLEPGDPAAGARGPDPVAAPARLPFFRRRRR